MVDDDTTGSDAQDRAEEVDDEMIRLDSHGTDPEGLPGINAYSDRGPMSSEDPSLLLGGSETQDEIHTREWRERDEERPGDPARLDRGGSAAEDLIDPAGATVDGRDVEKSLIGEQSPSDHDRTARPAEVEAIHVSDDDEDDDFGILKPQPEP